MIAISLQSGSNGNCIYIETPSVRLFVDAGLSGRQVERRLARFDRDPRKVAAVVISHDHNDHVCCAGVLQRKFSLPLFATRRTLERARQCHQLGRLGDIHYFRPGETFRLGEARIETLPTPHDAVEGVAFVIEEEGVRLGVLTDLGHVFPELRASMATLDAVFLESNYDEEMLDNGPYPASLKRRIRGDSGHISNDEAAGLIAAVAGGRLRWACLAHLSETNNDPETALRTHRRVLPSAFPLHVAYRDGPSALLRVS